jgi:hypothetical protein
MSTATAAPTTHFGDHDDAGMLPAIKRAAGLYLALSLATVVAIVALRDNSDAVTAAVWTRGIIVAASSLVTFLLTLRAERGSRGAYRRLRIISAAMIVAIVVIIALPGDFPLWVKIEQGACAIVLLRLAALLNVRRTRRLFAA